MKTSPYILGVDFGTQNIGLAIGQSITGTASPLITLNKKSTHFLGQFEDILKEWKPNTIIFGLPLNKDGSDQKITRQTRGFVEQIKKAFQAKYGFNLDYQDERYTSQAAESYYKGASAQNKQGINRDAYAAVLILESWFYEH